MTEYFCNKCGNDVGSTHLFCSNCMTSIFVIRKGTLKCKECGMKFEDKDGFDEHLISNHVCSICNKTFKTLKQRDIHYKTHLKCELCSEQFDTRLELNEHLKLIHLCKFCNQIFKTEKERDVHYKSHCKVCGKQLIDSNEYSKHLSTHPKCELCGKRFNDLSDFNTHLLSVHCCRVCDGVFKTENELIIHNNLHPTCEVCGKRLKDSNEYETHKFKEHSKIQESKKTEPKYFTPEHPELGRNTIPLRFQRKKKK